MPLSHSITPGIHENVLLSYRNMQLTVNRFPLVEQMHIYAKFKAESTRFLPVPVPVEDNGIDGEPVGSEALLKKAEIFEDLWRSDYQSLANQKRLAELKHPSHRELIDAEFLTELRACSNDVSALHMQDKWRHSL